MAPNKGTVAFRMADKPVLMDRSANEKQANGMAELSTPIKNIFLPMLGQLRPEPAPQQQRSQKQGGNGHPQARRRDGAKLLGTQAHEQKG